MRYYVLPVNPEPWAIGPMGVSRHNGGMHPFVGPNKQLVAYQEAVKEELASLNPEKLDGEIRLECWFWRRQDAYTTEAARKAQKNEADGTNLLKATEDACQGILFDNDRTVKHGTWKIVAQSDDIPPCVVIGIEQITKVMTLELPRNILEQVWQAQRVPELSDNSWPPRKVNRNA